MATDLLRTVCACATTNGGAVAMIRVSGPRCRNVFEHLGLELPAPWRLSEHRWVLPLGPCPVRLLWCPEGRSFSGCDSVEISLPGNPQLIDQALEALIEAGADMAEPGEFTRQALANGRLDLTQAESLLALVHSRDVAAAGRALSAMRGGLTGDLEPVRERLLILRALVEAGLDFVEEEDVSAYEPKVMAAELADLAAVMDRWRRAGLRHQRGDTVCLVGPPNAGKSALFNTLTGSQALVAPIAGTTRDWLEGEWEPASGLNATLIDTAGWMQASGVDADAVAAGRDRIAGAALVLVCSAPDAPAPPREHWAFDHHHALVVATKVDMGPADGRADVQVSALGNQGLDELADLVADRLGDSPGLEPRQEHLIAQAGDICRRLSDNLPPDELLADDLRRAADALGDLMGKQSADEILGAIFGRFCIGK